MLLGLTYQMTKADYIEKRIPLSAHRSSETLKDEVRKAVSLYRSLGLDLVNMRTEGSFVHLKFGRKDEDGATICQIGGEMP